ncbi:beta strand repeat-containing protein [Pseudomonas sp. KCJK9016]|uniref:beta strand repeat-containing protein n=1 Tax=Pseudomonas sp. KCJK9016 TaxID=3344556 RepID=UPI003905EEA0
MAVINGTNGADTLNGTSGDDEINGLGGNDVIIGSAGADKIDGGAGFDTVDYSASSAGVNVDIRPGTGLPGTGGDAQDDTLTGIEKVIGSAFNDTFTTEASLYATYEGGAGDDIYYVNGGGVTIIEQAGGGNDEVRVSWKDHTLAANIERLTYVGTGSFTGVGNASDNIITGGANNDILKGGGGADQFFGGAGRDTVSYDDSTVAVSINLKTGINSGIAAGDTYNSIEVIAGSNFNDTFVVDSRITAVDGGAGFDTVDYSTSSAGVNVDIRPGTGLAGIGGDSQGVTLTGIEKVIGSAFNDTFTTEASLYATYEGGAGDDVYYVNGGGVTIIEQAGGGNDEVRVSWKDHTLAANIERLTYVGTGSFTGVGNASDNIITGGANNDILKGGGGADQFFGGAGRDTVSYDDSTVAVSINLKTGINSGIAAGDTYNSIEVIAGSNFNDTFVVDSRITAVDGGAGFDTVDYSTSSAGVNVDIRPGTGLAGIGGDSQGVTLTGIEKVIGSAFSDTFTTEASLYATYEGGAGDDVYYVNGGGVTIIEQAGGGNDEVRVSWKDHTLAANIERLTYVGTGSFTGTGNDSDNIITGGAGNDILKGGGGADQFFGGAGMDTVSYDDSTVGVTLNLKTGINSGIAAGDVYNSIEAITGSKYNDTFFADSRVFAFDGGAGFDTVDYSASAEAVNVEIRPGTSPAGVGGDAQGDTLTNIEKVVGSAFNDTFTAAAISYATFEGGAGDDIYYVNGGGVTIIEQEGGGNDEIRVSWNTHTMAANVERMTYTGTAAFTGYGNASDNIITGGIGNDVLYGGGGADQFIGGAGMDTVSYDDSTTGVSINLKTGVNTGIATGDTYNSIEAMTGSKYNDVFVGSSAALAFNGGLGLDMVSYESSDSAVTIDLKTNANAGDAAGDTFAGIEIFQGTRFADTFLGSTANDNFVGGAGADVFDGREGIDTVWYANNATAVNINLQTGVSQGGDAEGDVFINIESLIGTNFNDTLIGNAAANGLEGGLGNDVIYGGDGNDVIYGSLYTPLGPFAVNVAAGGPQADLLYGGNGDDIIVGAPDDRGTQAFGEAGNDTITVAYGMADGGEGNDLLTGIGAGYSLFGGAGADKLVLQGGPGSAFGGEDNDTYTVNTSKLVTIQDTGTSSGDKLILSNISAQQLLLDRVGNDLFLHQYSVFEGQTPEDGVRLKDWFAGSNTIEYIQTSDGKFINLPTGNDGFAMFG